MTLVSHGHPGTRTMIWTSLVGNFICAAVAFLDFQ